jgi:Mrp family chromosome partitioning ATPase
MVHIKIRQVEPSKITITRRARLQAPLPDALRLAAQIRAARVPNSAQMLLVAPVSNNSSALSVTVETARALAAMSPMPVLILDFDTSHPEGSIVETRIPPVDFWSGKGDASNAVAPWAGSDLPPLCIARPFDVESDGISAVAGEEFRMLLKRARDSFSAILINGRPVLQSAATLLLANECDGVVLFVKQNSTKHSDARQACDLLRRSGGRLLGFVLGQG